MTLSILQGCFDSTKNKEEKILFSTPAKPQTRTLQQDSQNLPSTLVGLKRGILKTNQGRELETFIALTDQEQAQGLSGVRPEQFYDDQAMIFPDKKDNYRSFWMPDTYFELDIYFLDEHLKVLAVERNVPFHPGKENLETVARTRQYMCRHVLEIKSASQIAKSIQTGDQLTWVSSPNLEQIISSTPQGQ